MNVKILLSSKIHFFIISTLSRGAFYYPLTISRILSDFKNSVKLQNSELIKISDNDALLKTALFLCDIYTLNF